MYIKKTIDGYDKLGESTPAEEINSKHQIPIILFNKQIFLLQFVSAGSDDQICQQKPW